MKGTWTAPRIMAATGVLTMLVGGIGFLVVMTLNAFVLDEFDAYGEVPIPGAGQVQLPAGAMTISFHTEVTSAPSSSFRYPPLTLGIDPPPGAPDPVLTEDHGATTSFNNDVHMRIWTAQVSVAGLYRVRTGGDVDGYINPRLAFGHESDYDYLHYVFAAMFGVGVLDVIMSRVLKRLQGRGSPGVALQDSPASIAPVDPFTPTDQGVRLEQLKTIAALRDSGALTEAEFEAEKRRILRG